MQTKVQKSAAAAQGQVKKRTSLLSKLKRIKISSKSKSKRNVGGDSSHASSDASNSDPRHPKKRRSTWKRILGIPEVSTDDVAIEKDEIVSHDLQAEQIQEADEEEFQI